MESATKKKRGRPPKHEVMYTVFPDMEKRAAANLYFAAKFVRDVAGEKMGGNDNFFLTNRGKLKRQGIAEQLGRMLEAELITIEEGQELMQWAIDRYNSGYSVKQIESTLRLYRLNMEGQR